MTKHFSIKSSLISVLIYALTACTNTPMHDGPSTPTAPSVPPKPVEPTRPDIKPKGPATESPAPSGKGGYYKDDGPQAVPPADLDKLPDAVPTDEVPNVRYARPYKALGKEYRPMKSYAPYKERGIASWYGKRFHGNKTASGEIYDMNKMSAAHTVLPIPSYAKVTNISNGKSVVVRVNDRGPFHKDRMIDLSYAAAYKLGLITKGSGEVEIEAIDPKRASEFNVAGKSTPVKVVTKLEQPQQVPQNSESITPVSDVSGYFVQVAAFKSEESANRMRDKVRAELSLNEDEVQSWYNNGAHKVRAGPYASRAEAEKLVAKVKQTFGSSAMILYHD